jgi:hypothetical protein
MENMDKKECGCGMGGCGMGHMGGCGCYGGKHHLLRVVLKILIVILIFWCGFRLGELTGTIRGEYGRIEMMHGERGSFGDYGYDSGMMQGWNGGVQTPVQVPAATTPAK